MAKLVKYLIGIALLVTVAVWLIFYWHNPSPLFIKTEELIIVPKGASFSQVADSLAKYNLIRSKFSFKLAAKLVGSSSKLRPGSYQIAYGLTNTEIISRLTATEFAMIFEVTFPEGSHIRRVASIAKVKLGIDSAAFIALCKDTAFIRTLGIPKEAKTVEGYLFPETYRFYVSVSPQELVKKMVAEWKEKVPDSLLRKAKDLHFTTHQLMTFASIVEAEANRPDERDTIAGVYWNRLKIGMKLDADPTNQYGLELNRPITASELRIAGAYNTYQNIGLPPGPINNPGKAAIIAALNPARHNKIYFVARRDGSGGHYFSRTPAEQTVAIKKSNANQNGL